DQGESVGGRRQDTEAVTRPGRRWEGQGAVVRSITRGRERASVGAPEREGAPGKAAGDELGKRHGSLAGQRERSGDRELCRTPVGFHPGGGLPAEVQGVGVCWPDHEDREKCKNEGKAFHMWSTPGATACFAVAWINRRGLALASDVPKPGAEFRDLRPLPELLRERPD